MLKISQRQQEILNFIQANERASNKDILEYISSRLGDVSRYTIIRDLELLIKAGMVKKIGSGRNVIYKEVFLSKLLSYVDVENYFKIAPDDRDVKVAFDFSVFDQIGEIFSSQEKASLLALTNDYQKRLRKISTAGLKKEFERLTVEFSWKSSRIEGNTYDLVETEYLIKEKKEAEGHTREEAIMILNHKAALDYIRNDQDKYRKISIRNIEDIHRLLVEGLGVSGGIRRRLVGVTGTKYRPLDNEFQIKEALLKMCELVNSRTDAFEKSLLAHAFIAYIQAFEDGNKRTSRMLGNAVLMAQGACPLSFRSIDETEYKKAMLLFYEQNSLRYFKELFIEQYEFAVKNYFL